MNLIEGLGVGGTDLALQDRRLDATSQRSNNDDMPEMANAPKLAPLRTRLIVFALLALIAVASIWLIDRRAMKRMHEYRQQQQQQQQPTAQRIASLHSVSCLLTSVS